MELELRLWLSIPNAPYFVIDFFFYNLQSLINL
jgi:hypothetical protein